MAETSSCVRPENRRRQNTKNKNGKKKKKFPKKHGDGHNKILFPRARGTADDMQVPISQTAEGGMLPG